MFRSVRARLTVWYTAIVAIVLIAFGCISYALLAREIRSQTDASLDATAHEFASAFSNDPAIAEGRVAIALDYRYSDREILVISPAGQIVAASSARLSAMQRARIAALVRGGMTGLRTVRSGIDGGGIRLIALPMNVMGSRYIAVVARGLDEQAQRLKSAAGAILFGIPLALVIAAAGGYLMARKALQPVLLMSGKARQISAETLNERIEVGNERDELGFLAATLNDLLERLQDAFESQHRFMADASHELRTPLAIIQGEADVILSRAHRKESEYRDSIGLIQKSALRLTRIVRNLFLLARADAGPYPMTKSRLYVDEVIDHAVRSMQSIATAAGVHLTSEAPADFMIEADEELLHGMLLNLIHNAVKFTRAGGSVIVRTQVSDDRIVVRVADTGCGIPAADQPRIFDRFFRGRRTRGTGAQGATGGAGLGLPIARWIAMAHNGSLELERSDATGSCFVITLPLDRQQSSGAAVRPQEVSRSV